MLVHRCRPQRRKVLYVRTGICRSRTDKHLVAVLPLSSKYSPFVVQTNAKWLQTWDFLNQISLTPNRWLHVMPACGWSTSRCSIVIYFRGDEWCGAFHASYDSKVKINYFLLCSVAPWSMHDTCVRMLETLMERFIALICVMDGMSNTVDDANEFDSRTKRQHKVVCCVPSRTRIVNIVVWWLLLQVENYKVNFIHSHLSFEL